MQEQEPTRPRGRPKGSGKGLTKNRIHLYIDPEYKQWAAEQPGGVSATVRRLLEEAYLRENAAS